MSILLLILLQEPASGLAAHAGSTDGSAEVELARTGKFLVHGLALHAAELERARAGIRSAGLYPLASVESWNGSTLPYADKVAADDSRVRTLLNTYGRGPGNAIRYGIEHAAAPVAVVTMADGSDDPRQIDPLALLVGRGVVVAAASRYMPGGHQVGGPPLKRLLSRVAGLTLHWFAGVPTHDPTNNFKLYARRFLDTVTIESTAGFELALELTVKATLAGRRVAEVPTTWRDRTAGESNFQLRKWLPHYLHWYRVAFVGRWSRRRRGGRTAQA